MTGSSWIVLIISIIAFAFGWKLLKMLSAYLATNAGNRNIRKAAVKILTDQTTLADIANNDRDW
ncbi:hypothetical protein MBAV_000736, partial [Candidatus Magnetobacterium bavaricum]